MRFIIVIVALSLSACATTPISVDQASAVPASRVLAPQFLSQAAYTGSLVVKRDSGFMGSACKVRVFLDAVPVADLGPSEKVELFVALGEHIVGATATGMICGGGVAEATIVVKPEHLNVLRVASGQSGDIHLQPSAF